MRDRVRVVFASSSSIYGAATTYPTTEQTLPAPNSPYGVSKLAVEYLAAAYSRAFGLDVVVLRYSPSSAPGNVPTWRSRVGWDPRTPLDEGLDAHWRWVSGRAGNL